MIINTDLIYPIGSIYLSVNATNPSKYFGGTWEQITSDAYLKIVSSELEAGQVGGTSADHKIPVSSMPSHNHNIIRDDGGNATNMAWGTASSNTGYISTMGQNLYKKMVVQNTGGGQAYYPYYYGVYVWKRVA